VRDVRASWPVLAFAATLLAAGAAQSQPAPNLAAAPTAARAANGDYIAWREHIIDDEAVSGIELRGADGLVMADLDKDGYDDIVSVHESDVEYDGVADGFIRIAFGTADPDRWRLVTLAAGAEAGAAEDAAIGDVDGDGYLDIVAACELAHLIYFQNPGADAASARWDRLIPTATLDRGSFIRVFIADLNGDGRPEITTANKGAQDPTQAAQEPKAISFFEIDGKPLEDSAWKEHVLTEVPWPINAEPVDLDGDDDLDIVGGSVAQGRIVWFENRAHDGTFEFVEHSLAVEAPPGDDETPVVNGFNMEFADLDSDGRLDIVTFDTARLIGRSLVWLEQPAKLDAAWRLHRIGTYAPDQIVGLAVADITGDGLPDVMTGGYSLGSRTSDEVTPERPLGRLAWFENRGGAGKRWIRHDFSRRQRGMFDKFVAKDMDGDGDLDFASTRGNSGPYDGVFWIEQIRSEVPIPAFTHARATDSPEVALTTNDSR
jgi:FG-GAP-like repeat